jgi:hypothetical protein
LKTVDFTIPDAFDEEELPREGIEGQAQEPLDIIIIDVFDDENSYGEALKRVSIKAVF